jgi:hypothetical protein
MPDPDLTINVWNWCPKHQKVEIWNETCNANYVGLPYVNVNYTWYWCPEHGKPEILNEPCRDRLQGPFETLKDAENWGTQE